MFAARAPLEQQHETESEDDQGRGRGGAAFLDAASEDDVDQQVGKDRGQRRGDGKADPARDIETIELELVLADMEYMIRRLDKVAKSMKGGDKKLEPERVLYEKINAGLEEGISARLLDYDEDEQKLLSELSLLSMKPVLYACNIAESDIGNDDLPYVDIVKEIAEKENCRSVVISAKIEEEIAMLDDDEKAVFLTELGLSQTGLDQMVQVSYNLLGLISFLTAGPTEVRAWTIKQGTKAPGAAGKIHSDFERGFIRAEVVAYKDLVECGTYNAAKEKGLVRSEGKEYIMKDGDVVLFRFNV